MPQHPRDCQPFLGLFPVIAVVPGRVRHDCLAPDPVESDRLCRNMNRSRNRDYGRYHFRIGNRPLRRQHSAHRTADHGKQFLDSEVVDQEFLRPYHVLNRNDGKIHTVRLSGIRINGTGTGRAGTSAENIAADDEVFFRVERPAGTDHFIPPAGLAVIFAVTPGKMRISGQSVFHENGIGRIHVQRAVSLVTDVQITQRLSAVQFQQGIGMKILRHYNSYA